jgi:hypothetical protein
MTRNASIFNSIGFKEVGRTPLSGYRRARVLISARDRQLRLRILNARNSSLQLIAPLCESDPRILFFNANQEMPDGLKSHFGISPRMLKVFQVP